MHIALKKLPEQVVVITGATSGIGLVTARMAARHGASLVLAARNEQALQQLTEELTAQGARVIFVVADVGEREQVRAVARAAIDHFGGFDSWVNNAGISIYGRADAVSEADQRRLFDTNFWGVVNGSLIACEHLREHGGALINLGSEVSDVAAPLQGMYSASKHAVKGFTDALRIELQHECAPVSVTLIKPAGIDTMFVEHAKNAMDVKPQLPPPVYAPELVAKAILHAAQRPVRDLYVGGASRALVGIARLAPRLSDWLSSKTMFRAQRSEQPAGNGERDALYEAGVGLRERQGANTPVLENSLYTQAAMHPKASMAAGAAMALGLVWWLVRRSRTAA